MSQPDPARQINIRIGKVVNAAARRPPKCERGRILIADAAREWIKDSCARGSWNGGAPWHQRRRDELVGVR